MLALRMGSDRWLLEREEAHRVAEAYVAVQRHYKPLVSGKTLDWARLVGALGMVYGTRALGALQDRRAPKRGPADVVTLHPVQPAPAGAAAPVQTTIRAMAEGNGPHGAGGPPINGGSVGGISIQAMAGDYSVSPEDMH